MSEELVKPKKPWTSKTFYAAILTAALSHFPAIQIYVAAHPDIVLSALGIVFGALRFVTKGRITIK